jgi:hypothetical protein
MLWIKRNLFLAIGGLVALLLLAGGGYYVYSAIGRNTELSAEVEATRTKLNDLYKLDPFPHATNITAAKTETARLNVEIAKGQKLFAAVATERVDARGFTRMRDTTLDELRTLAMKAQIALPVEGYAFSFQTQRSRSESSLAPDTFPLVPQQLMEIKALCLILYDARINQIANIRRARVSRDDYNAGNASDYLSPILANAVVTEAEAASHPYEFTFFCFTAELAAVLNGIQHSPSGFVVKAMMVEPDSSAPGALIGNPGAAPVPVPQPGIQPPRPRRPNPLNPAPAQPVRPAGAVAPVRNAANDRPIHVLKEKRLKVTMLVYAIKPSK